jgi:hypothetical protein
MGRINAERESDEKMLREAGWDWRDAAEQERLSKPAFPQKLQWLEEARRVLRQLKRKRDVGQGGGGSDTSGAIRE